MMSPPEAGSTSGVPGDFGPSDLDLEDFRDFPDFPDWEDLRLRLAGLDLALGSATTGKGSMESRACSKSAGSFTGIPNIC